MAHNPDADEARDQADERREVADDKREVADKRRVVNLDELAKSQDAGLANVATALMAWSQVNEADRIDRKRAEKLTIIQNTLIFIGLAILIFAAWQSYEQRNDVAHQTRQIEECTGSDPNTACRKQQAKDTTPVVNDLRLSIDCASLYAQGKMPEPCSGVAERLRNLEMGVNPFPTTTTTTLKGE